MNLATTSARVHTQSGGRPSLMLYDGESVIHLTIPAGEEDKAIERLDQLAQRAEELATWLRQRQGATQATGRPR